MTTTPLIWWRFDSGDNNFGANTTADNSGNGNTGTLVSMTSGNQVSGEVNQALTTNGSSQYVKTSSGITLSSGSLAMGGYFKNSSRPSAGNFQSLCGKWFGSSTWGWRLQVDSTGQINFNYRRTGSSSDRTWATGYILPTSAFHHIFITVDSSASGSGTMLASLYVDGFLYTTSYLLDSGGLQEPNTVPFGAGAVSDNGTFGQFFNGTMDEVRLYDQTLKASEVLTLAAAINGNATISVQLIGESHVDSGSTATSIDFGNMTTPETGLILAMITSNEGNSGVTSTNVKYGSNSMNLQLATSNNSKLETIATANSVVAGTYDITTALSSGIGGHNCSLRFFLIVGLGHETPDVISHASNTTASQTSITTTLNFSQANGLVIYAGQNNCNTPGSCTWSTAGQVCNVTDGNGAVYCASAALVTSSGSHTETLTLAGSTNGGGAQIMAAYWTGSVAYSLSVADGTLTLTGESVHWLTGLISAFGSFSLTGENATIGKGFKALSALVGSFVLTGKSVAWGIAKAVSNGSFILTGKPLISFGLLMSVAAGAFTLAGKAATALYGFPAAFAQFGLTGTRATMEIVDRVLALVNLSTPFHLRQSRAKLEVLRGKPTAQPIRQGRSRLDKLRDFIS